MSFQLSAIGDGNEQATSEAAPGVLVILGASGDLTKRLLMPAAYGRLRELVEEVGGGTAAAGNTLLCLAISPDFFTVVTTPTWFATRRPGSWRRCGCFVPVMLPATVSAASMVQASTRTAPHRLATARSPTSIRSRTRRRSPPSSCTSTTSGGPVCRSTCGAASRSRSGALRSSCSSKARANRMC